MAFWIVHLVPYIKGNMQGAISSTHTMPQKEAQFFFTLSQREPTEGHYFRNGLVCYESESYINTIQTTSYRYCKVVMSSIPPEQFLSIFSSFVLALHSHTSFLHLPTSDVTAARAGNTDTFSPFFSEGHVLGIGNDWCKKRERLEEPKNGQW